MTYSGTDWRVGTAAGGIYTRRDLRCTRKHMSLYAIIPVLGRYSRQLSGLGLARKRIRAMPVAGKALVRRSKQSRAELADRLQRVDSANASSSDEADALLESLKRS